MSVREFGALPSLRGRWAQSDTLKAAGLAAAMIATNFVALVLTVVFGRILGTTGYGSVSALLSAFLILAVLGQAMQLATARAGARGELGTGPVLLATMERWTRGLAVVTVVAVGVGALARVPLAGAIGVDERWAAASVLPTGVLWLLLSVQRGIFLATGDYKVVGISMVVEQVGRLVFGAGLALVGLGPTGAFLGTPVAMIAVSVGLTALLRRRLGDPAERAEHSRRLRAHLAVARAPVLGLALVACLQNIDVIVAKHRLSDTAAGAYASAAVAGKVVVWVAVGVAFYVVPEATRRAAAGEDTRGVLLRGLALLGIAAVPALAILAGFPHLLLKLAFGPKFAPGGDVLLLLGLAFTLLAAVYLCAQYLLALGSWRFLVPLAVVALAEPLALLLPAAHRPALAEAVLAVEASALAVTAIAALGAHRRP